MTWQVSPRNKINFQDSEQYNSANRTGGGSSTRTPEAQGVVLYTPGHTRVLTWTSPFSNRLLLEAGWGSYMANYANDAPRIDGQHNSQLISVFDQGISPGTGITGLTYRFDNPLGGGFQHHQIGTLANLRASISYVTGAHNMKVGYMGGFSNPSQSYYNFTPFVQYRFNNGVPNQLTQTAQFGGSGASAVELVRNLVPTSFFAQDQWTKERLTLQGGVRYDHILSSYPDSCVGGPDYPLMPKQICYPARSTPGVHWSDLTPRIGAAYDLFGNGKTAVKFNIGKYMQALTASNSDMDLNPLIRLNLQTTRTWDDRAGRGINGDFVPQCDLLNPAANGECGAMDNQNFGKEFFTRTFDPNFIDGFGVRPYNWELGVSVQQQVTPRIGVTVGYFRRWFGNFYTLDNTLTAASDYTQFSVPIPSILGCLAAAAEWCPASTISTSTSSGRSRTWRSLSSNLGAEPTENWQGVDASVNARLRNGITLQGGTSTGRLLQDNCALRSALPETYSWATIDITQALRGDSAAGLTSTLLPDRVPVPDVVSGPGHLRRSEAGCPGRRDMAKRPGRRADRELRGDERHREQRAATARPQPFVRQHHGQPDPAGHALWGSPQQPRFPCGEDHPLPPHAHAGRRRHLQRHEHGRRHDLQPGILADRRLADAGDHPAGALREDQRAGRLLM